MYDVLLKGKKQIFSEIKGAIRATGREVGDMWRVAGHVAKIWSDLWQESYDRRIYLRLRAIDRIKAKYPDDALTARFLEGDLPQLRAVYYEN